MLIYPFDFYQLREAMNVIQLSYPFEAPISRQVDLLIQTCGMEVKLLPADRYYLAVIGNDVIGLIQQRDRSFQAILVHPNFRHLGVLKKLVAKVPRTQELSYYLPQNTETYDDQLDDFRNSGFTIGNSHRILSKSGSKNTTRITLEAC